PLPAPADARFGPPEVVDAVVAAIRDSRLVTLVGPGGIGKTRLALAAAAALPGRVVWVDAAGAATLADLWTATAGALEVTLGPGDPLEALVRAVRRAGRLTLALDNLEQVADASHGVAGLLAGAPDLVVLATSRVRLRTRGERAIEVAARSPRDAAALFVDRATRPPDPAEADEVAALVQLLEGHPLAIELAAARTAVLGVAAIRERARRPLALLVTRDQARDERHHSLRASIDASAQLLTPAARTALGQLSVFVGSFALEAAERVLGPLDDPREPVDVLEELIDWCLVRIDRDHRLSVLPLIRDYAAELPSAEARAAAEVRHGQVYGSPPADDLSGPREVELARRMVLDLPNHRAALERAVARDDGPAAVGALECAAHVTLRHGQASAVVADAELVLTCTLDPRARATAEWVAARAAFVAGDADAVDRHLPAALALAREVGDPELGFRVAQVQATSAHQRRDAATFAAAARDGLAFAEQLDRPTARMAALLRLSRVHSDAGDWPRAWDALGAARALAPSCGPTLDGELTTKLTSTSFAQGDLEGFLRRCESLRDRLGDDPVMSLQQGVAALMLDRNADAVRFGTDALRSYSRAGLRRGRVSARTVVGWALLDLGQLEGSEAAFAEAAAEAAEIEAPGDEGKARHGLVQVAVERGDLERADAELATALRRTPGDHAGALLGWLGRVRGLQRRWAEALDAFDRAARVAEPRQHPTVWLWHGATHADLDQLEPARALLESALAHGVTGGFRDHARALLAGVAAREGRASEARALLAQVGSPTGLPSRRAAVALAEAELAAAEGRRADAVAALERAEAATPALGARFEQLRRELGG
ncbi:MAG: hypothetical protein ABMA64_39135, partial [Myxococcota bacterium]